jgi:hypothetical protein
MRVFLPDKKNEPKKTTSSVPLFILDGVETMSSILTKVKYATMEQTTENLEILVDLTARL